MWMILETSVQWEKYTIDNQTMFEVYQMLKYFTGRL